MLQSNFAYFKFICYLDAGVTAAVVGDVVEIRRSLDELASDIISAILRKRTTHFSRGVVARPVPFYLVHLLVIVRPLSADLLLFLNTPITQSTCPKNGAFENKLIEFENKLINS